MLQMCLESVRMQIECTPIVAETYFDTKNDRLGCSSNAVRIFQTSLEYISNAFKTLQTDLDWRRMSSDVTENTRRIV